MYQESNTVRECDRCERVGLDVDRTRVDGQRYALCPACSREVTLGGATCAQ
jgi:hypothetical protein